MESKTFHNSSFPKFGSVGRGGDAANTSKPRGGFHGGRGSDSRGRGRGRGQSNNTLVTTSTEIQQQQQTHKSKQVAFHSSFKNDPFLDDAFELPVPLQLVPKTIVPEVSPDLSGFPTIVDTIYEDIITLDLNRDCSGEVLSSIF